MILSLCQDNSVPEVVQHFVDITENRKRILQERKTKWKCCKVLNEGLPSDIYELPADVAYPKQKNKNTKNKIFLLRLEAGCVWCSFSVKKSCGCHEIVLL